MTDEMLALARANAVRAGVTNVEFHRGQIESLPLPDAAVDVVLSNCVVNLSPDKPAVLAEAIEDALAPFGVRHVDMPVTPARVWEAMQRKWTEPSQ